jgi:ABC-2 type transport system permease protein
MPDGLRQFSQYEPFSPVVDTGRGLLTDAGMDSHATVAVGWSRGIAAVSNLWATRLYNRRRAAHPA